MDVTAILQPVLAMGLLTVVMAIWMGATRLPAMAARKIDAQEAQDTSRLRDMLPHEVMRVSNNYNHLFEQPTLFYATAISIAVAGIVDPTHVQCAWVFTAFRVAHSLVQATVDIVIIRFTLFVLSWIALATMIIRASLQMF